MRSRIRYAPPIALAILLTIACGGPVVHADTTDSTTYGSGTFGGCDYGSCSITLSSSGAVSLNVVPAATSKCTVSSDTVSVLTDSNAGYNLSFTTSTTNRSMTSGGNSLSASSGTKAVPVSLAANNWGYRVDGLGGFGAGPTSPQSSGSTPAVLFAGVPASNQTADQLASTSSAANPAVNTAVWYGVCANTSEPSGNYGVTVTYTATTN